MTTQTEAITGEAVAPPDRGPRASLQVLRVFAVLHSLAFLAQPVFAGGYLMGDIDSLGLHRLNAAIVTALDLAQLISAMVYFWGGRGRVWPLWASLAVALFVEVQVGMGFDRVLVVHLPLGVSLTVGQILITVWLFKAGASVARPRKPRRARRRGRRTSDSEATQ